MLFYMLSLVRKLLFGVAEMVFPPMILTSPPFCGYAIPVGVDGLLRFGHNAALTATGSHSLPRCRFATPATRLQAVIARIVLALSRSGRTKRERESLMRRDSLSLLNPLLHGYSPVGCLSSPVGRCDSFVGDFVP